MRFMREVAQSERIKEYAKYYVFCKINTDQQPNVAKAYQVSALPTHLITDENGAVLVKQVGYGGPAAFYAWFDQNK